MMKLIGGALLLGLAFVGARTYIASSGSDDVSTRLQGKGFSPSLNLDVMINAIQHKNGKVTGVSMVPKNFKGKVIEVSSADPVELASPGNGRDFWCVNLSVKGTNEFSNWLWFVKDVDGGPDLLSFDAGFNLSCAAAGTPVQPFEPISSGDFKGEIK